MSTMKKILTGLMTLSATVFALSACQKTSDGAGAGGSPANVVPVQTCNIPGNTNCNPGNYLQIGPQLQTYQWSNANGFCGCPSGYRPVMNAQWGISCAPSGWFPNSAFYGFDYSQVIYPSQNTNQWMSIPQVTYSPALSGNSNNCFSNAASVCDIRNANSCSSGGTCRPSSGGSYLGFCAYGTGIDSYTTHECRWEWDAQQGQVYRCQTN